MAVFTIDVWHCTEADWPIHMSKADWRRYVVEAPDWVASELVACQMAMRHGHVAQAVVIDWEE